MDDERTHDYLAACAELLAELRTAHLATADARGVPQASVAPFVCHGGALHVYLSALAAHTANLRARAEVSVLLVRDEASCPDAFARPRVTLQCSVAELARGAAPWHTVLDAFEARFGASAAMVRPLPDFALFRLEPRAARIVTGFGRARRLDGAAVARMCRAERGA